MKTSLRFIRHGGIYRSDVSSQLADQGRRAAFRTVRPQPKDAGSFYALLIVATSSGRLFLNGVLASSARLPLHRHAHPKPFRDRRQ